MQRENLVRLLMQALVEHGEAGELIISHEAANALDLRRFVIDTLPMPDGRMAIRRRDTVLQATPGRSGPQLAEAQIESTFEQENRLRAEAIEEEERLNSLDVTIPPPCVCTHSRMRHIAGIGRCGEGVCNCEAYDPAVTVA